MKTMLSLFVFLALGSTTMLGQAGSRSAPTQVGPPVGTGPECRNELAKDGPVAKLSESEARRMVRTEQKPDLEGISVKADQKVTIDIVVSAGGQVACVTPSWTGAGDAVQQSALTAVRRWKFIPHRVGGKPTPFETTLTFNFSAK